MRVILEISEDSQLGSNFGSGAWGPGQDSLSQHRGGDRNQTGLGAETQLSRLLGLKYGDNLSPPLSLNFSNRREN